MAFGDFRNYDEVIEKYRLSARREDFIPLLSPAMIDPRFRDQIGLVWREFPFQRSEAAVSQSLVFPILFEVWKHYREHLLLLSQEPLRFDDELSGTPEFMVAKKSPRDPVLPELPFLRVGEAKNDEFYRGWGQALSAMVAVRKRNGDLVSTIFGIATNGQFWQFGKLEHDTFVLDQQPFYPGNLDQLMAALHFVFAACCDQVLRLPTAA